MRTSWLPASSRGTICAGRRAARGHMDHLQSLHQIFSNRLLFIPDYQRGYAWTKDHQEDLWEDLEALAPGQQHFTGTLVLHRRGSGEVQDEDGQPLAEWDVVDGQQ